MQAQLNFSIHETENNIESQSLLEEKRAHFSKQCELVYNLLKSGIRLTRLTAATQYNILSLERRVKDLKENKIDVLDVWVKNNEGKRVFKEYYL